MRRLGTLVVILAILATACSSSNADEPATTSQPPTTEAPTTTTVAPTTTTESVAVGGLVLLAESSLGSVLVDGDGYVLYLFTPDGQGESVSHVEDSPDRVNGVLREGQSMSETRSSFLLRCSQQIRLPTGHQGWWSLRRDRAHHHRVEPRPETLRPASSPQTAQAPEEPGSGDRAVPCCGCPK